MKFKMDWDNIPGKGTLMLFKDNEDGTLSLATPDDVRKAIAEATKILQAEIESLQSDRTDQEQVISRLKKILKGRDEALRLTNNQLKKLVGFLDEHEITVGSFGWIILRDFDYRRIFEANDEALSKTWEEGEK